MLGFKATPTGGKFGKSKKLADKPKNLSPGPAQYTVKNSLTKPDSASNLFTSKSTRDFDLFLKNKQMDTPGPGKYNKVHKPSTNTAVKISKPPKKNKSKKK